MQNPDSRRGQGSIVLTHCDYDGNSVESIKTHAKDDPQLIAAINNVADDLVKKDIEIFERYQNILITEQGYYFAFFESDLMIVHDAGGKEAKSSD